MPTNITDSPDIVELDSLLVADMCSGAFYISLGGSVWIGTGYDDVEGADVKITNPYGVVVKNYPTSGYDIYPPMTSVIGINIPTQAGNFQYGNYTIDVRLTDSNGNEYTVTKTLNLCQPDANNKTRNYGSLSAKLDGVCSEGKMYVITDTPPNYKGNIVESQVNDLTLEYPTGSGLDELETDVAVFSVQLFEGVYKITGTICATYNNGDNVYFKVNYRVKKKKEIYCSIDDCCVMAKFSELSAQLNSDCTDAEKAATTNVIVEGLFYYESAKIAAKCGEDPSDFIAKLEAILGCRCTCNCNEGTPVINNNPVTDYSITGCNVTSETVGLTTVYNIENYAYVSTVDPNDGILTVGSQTLSSCTKSQAFNFDITKAYAKIKLLADATTAQGIFWASIVNKPLNSIDATCLGYSAPQWTALTFTEKWTAVMAFMCACCACEATITEVTITKSGSNAIITWTATDEFSVDIYVDGVFLGNVLSTVSSFTVIGGADGDEHTYRLIAKCDNNKYGIDSTAANGTFTLFACAQIEPPSVSSNNVNGVDCPYDLTALVDALPSGVTAEWHTANNTSASSLLGNPASVSSGSYWVFAKDDEGCYSIGINVIVVCDSESACTAPQTLFVSTITGGNLVQFQSAAFPPPLNSYTVKRRLASAPDISGSYTTIGTPAWNPSSMRWEILDATASNNVLYVYKAQSNCADASTPNIQYTYANLVCPLVNLGAADDLVTYSFTNPGGGIDQIRVMIYDSTGTTLMETDTHLPAFSSPVSGTFMYLSEATTYQVRVRLYIGTYYKDCPLQAVTTTSDVPTTGHWYNAVQYECPCEDPLGSTIIHSVNPLELSKFYECDGYPEIFFFVTAEVANPGVSVPEAIETAYENCGTLCTGTANQLAVPAASECSACTASSYPLTMYTGPGDTIPTIGMQCYSDSGLTTHFSGGGTWYKLVWNGATPSSVDVIKIGSTGLVLDIGVCSVDCGA